MPHDPKGVSMTPEEPGQRALEITISERVFSRLKTQMLVVYIVSFVLAAAVAWSLTWQYRTLSDLASTRISEYQLLVTEGLEELHRLPPPAGGAPPPPPARPPAPPPPP